MRFVRVVVQYNRFSAYITCYLSMTWTADLPPSLSGCISRFYCCCSVSGDWDVLGASLISCSGDRDKPIALVRTGVMRT